jgi:DNA-binding NtrC family response regulator
MSEVVEVMVLDDESMVCERLRGPLTEEGYSVETFTDSQSALERLATKDFDVVVSDLKMKGATGLDLLRHVRDHAPWTQVIIITGYATIQSAREAEFCGVYDFVTKPFKIKDLVKMVAKASRKAARARARERTQ